MKFLSEHPGSCTNYISTTNLGLFMLRGIFKRWPIWDLLSTSSVPTISMNVSLSSVIEAWEMSCSLGLKLDLWLWKCWSVTTRYHIYCTTLHDKCFCCFLCRLCQSKFLFYGKKDLFFNEGGMHKTITLSTVFVRNMDCQRNCSFWEYMIGEHLKSEES